MLEYWREILILMIFLGVFFYVSDVHKDIRYLLGGGWKWLRINIK